MTQKEIKDKIADWENRLKNPSIANTPSAVKKGNEEIAKLEAMFEKDDNIVTDKATIQKIKNSINEGELILKSGKSHGRKMSQDELESILNSVNKERVKIGMPEFEKPKAKKKEKIAKEPKDSNIEKEAVNKTKSKYKIGQEIKIKDTKTIGKIVSIEFNEEVKQYTYEIITGSKIHYTVFESEIELVQDKKEKAKKEKNEAKETKAEEKSEHKKADYDCNELKKIAEERHARAKAAAEARAEAPKKSEATKDKEKIEKVHEAVEKHIEKGKFTRPQLEKLIAETKDLLKLLEKAFKNL